MGKVIWYKDLQYEREISYFEKINKEYIEITNQHGLVANKIYSLEHEFFNLLSNAVRIDRHPSIAKIITEIRSVVGLEIPISIFLYQSGVPKALCTPRVVYDNDDFDRELIILVSQHFFNGLDKDEKSTIISHEIAHLIYEHINVPVNVLLEGDFNLEQIGDFKFNLLKWSLCKEITADLFSLVSTNFNFIACSNTLIKYNFGFDELEGESILNLVLEQYDELADAVYENELSTHPLIPLRIKVLKEVIQSELVKNFGKEVSEEDYKKYVNEFNKIIDKLVSNVYPEVIAAPVSGNEVLFEMAIAVALSDGEVSKSELNVLNSMVSSDFNVEKYMDDINRMLSISKGGFQSVVSDIIKICVDKTVKKGCTKHDLVPVIRQLIGVAASDGIVEIEELETINKYAKHFDFSRNEIILLAAGLGFL